MEAIAWHLTFRLAVDRDIAPTSPRRRLLARTVARVGRPFPVLAFRWADTHGHVLVMGDRRSAGELARRLEIALQKALRPGVPFARVHFTPVYDTRHLKSAFLYVLGQDRHHGLPNDPFHEASNLPDLLGARTLALWTVTHVRTHLPRIRRADLLAIAGWRDDAEPGIDDLAVAAAAAVGLSDLSANSPDARRARRAAVEVGSALPSPALAKLLGSPRRPSAGFADDPWTPPPFGRSGDSSLRGQRTDLPPHETSGGRSVRNSEPIRRHIRHLVPDRFEIR